MGVTLQLSLHADYACRVLIYLAVHGAELVAIQDIAEGFNISKNHLIKIVHRLGQLGFVETVRGRGGGIRLANAPEKVSIGQVVRQMEQPNFNLVECFERETNTCAIVKYCGLKPHLFKAMGAFLSTLDQVTLADVVIQSGKLRHTLSIATD